MTATTTIHAPRAEGADFNTKIEASMDNRATHGGQPRLFEAAKIPHIDDIVAKPTDVDMESTINVLVKDAEDSFRKAEELRSQNKLVEALRKYIRANYILATDIRRHRDFDVYRDTSPGLFKWQGVVLRNVEDKHKIYGQIINSIRADNRLTGVKPTLVRTVPSEANGNSKARPSSSHSDRGTAYNTTQPATASAQVGDKVKPVVQPKPQSLHGNVIRNNHTRASSVSSVVNDPLAARFANLRGPQTSHKQDPRIKTHPIIPPKPAGPRDMAPAQRPSLALGTSSLPKVPDAIYSPVRTNSSNDIATLPSSASRGQFMRSSSSASIHSLHQQPPQRPSYDYTRPPPPPPATNTPPPELPCGDVITAESLYKVTKNKAVSVLLIDVRPRDYFDEGHIMATNIISVESSVLLREDIGPEQISESLILSPSHEKELFDKRNTFHLVVYYDQESKSVPPVARNTDEIVLRSLRRALVDLSFDMPLKQPPMLLSGGLDAWTDLMGTGSLQSASSSTSTAGVHAAARRRRGAYPLRTLRPDEARAWQEKVMNDDRESHIVRTATEYLQQPSRDRQSMISSQPSRAAATHWTATAPAPPAFPNRALIQQKTQVDAGHEAGVDRSTTGSSGSTPSHPSNSVEVDVNNPPTGLDNPGNWCYANSVIQSLLASSFGKAMGGNWRDEFKVPKKAQEKIEQPQLMMQILSNLFSWMSTRKFEVMQAQTLMGYSKHLSAHALEKFGDQNQHDAHEFLTFVFAQIDDETNKKRDIVGHVPQPDTNRLSQVAAAMEFWRLHSERSQSIIDQHWRGIEMSAVRCNGCNHHTYSHNVADYVSVNLPSGGGTLDHALRETISQHDELSDFDCENCQKKQPAVRWSRYPRLADNLCIVLNRFTKGLLKSTDKITWDLNHLDMTPYTLDEQQSSRSQGRRGDEAFAGPFLYECYAVVQHYGTTLNSGHYVVYIRDSKAKAKNHNGWWLCSDAKVTMANLEGKTLDTVFKSGDRVPYMAFFRRKTN